MATAKLSTFYTSDIYGHFVSNPELKELVGVITTPSGEKPAVSYKSERPTGINSISKIEVVIDDLPQDLSTVLMDGRTKTCLLYTSDAADE